MGLLRESFPGFLFHSFLLSAASTVQFTAAFTLFVPRHKKFASSSFFQFIVEILVSLIKSRLNILIVIPANPPKKDKSRNSDFL